MEYRRLGRTNLNVSVVSLGGVPLFFQPVELAIKTINFALDEGVNYFDLESGTGVATELKFWIGFYNGDRDRNSLLPAIKIYELEMVN